MPPMCAELAGHPDSVRWNARYQGDFVPSFAAHPLAELALSMPLPPGPVLDLACGPSGSALLAAATGRRVTAVDVSDVALTLLAGEAARRGVADLINLRHADLGTWRPPPDSYAFVLATGYWDRALFAPAAAAVSAGGLLAWEAFTTEARRTHPSLPAAWCLAKGEPATLLPPTFDVISQTAHPDAPKRRLLARRAGTPS
jgi:SAM-dependent methyltransferase